MVKVNVKNGTLDQKEIDAYVQYAIEATPENWSPSLI